jgi:tetratricopeptide (TPR) repeat protein
MSEARALVELGFEVSDADHSDARRRLAHGILGLVEHWEGDAGRAVEQFAAAEELRRASGSGEPTKDFYAADHVEALLELGRVEEALAVLEPWEAAGARLGREWTVAEATRCRGLVASAHGEVADAEALLDAAAARHGAVGDPFGRARALLALGAVRRRGRQKRAARAAIEEGLVGFEELGAVGWAGKARAELGRIGGRTREEGLTPGERRVAELAAGGTRTARSLQPSSSPSAPSRGTSRTCTRSSTSAPGPSWPEGSPEPGPAGKVEGFPRFLARGRGLASLRCRATSSRPSSPTWTPESVRCARGEHARSPRS